MQIQGSGYAGQAQAQPQQGATEASRTSAADVAAKVREVQAQREADQANRNSQGQEVGGVVNTSA